MFIQPSKLKDYGIMGMNQRNLDFIGRYNDRSKYPLVDNKLKTKRLSEEHGVNVPKLLAVVERQHEISQVVDNLKQLSRFAIKPAKGSGGKGIWVISGRTENGFVKTSGAEVSFKDFERHLSNILAGLYSLSGTPDVAIIETLIEFDDVFMGLSYQGVPDIRLIVFQGYPVMAMLRCATQASDGKANLHQGAVGIGLDMAKGTSLRAMQNGRPISEHPDTGANLLTIEIPNWREFLLLAAHCYEMTGLGYIGADLVLDKNQGALLLELNARPGLAIQIANKSGLLPRLKMVESIAKKHRSPQERVAIAMDEFGSMT